VDVLWDQEGINIGLEDVDHSIRIPVVEKSTEENNHLSAVKRMWELIVPESCLMIGLEILRLPTTLMIWGARKFIRPKSARKNEFIGKIELGVDLGPLDIVIFHSEEVKGVAIKPEILVVYSKAFLTPKHLFNLDKQRTNEKPPEGHF